MAMLASLHRIGQMDAAEVRFRAASELRKASERAQYALSRPEWSRAALARTLDRSATKGSRDLTLAKTALEGEQWHAAHRLLAAHFASRASNLAIAPGSPADIAAHVRACFPDAVSAAAARADGVLSGRYDLLGYREVQVGTPPRWHSDPIHGGSLPLVFWADIDYLNPAYGDHKVIWELNRHQHWLALGRAFQLTQDRRYYIEFVAQLESWIASNPPLTGGNWASALELAFRSLSWLWALWFFTPAVVDDPDGGAPWTVDLMAALDRQLSHLEHNLSVYFSPNTHLSGEALALYVAGISLPELAASGRRAHAGRRILLRETTRQITADGGHAELSPHYHRYSTEFYLLATAAGRRADDPAAAVFERAAGAQAEFLRTIADDGGRIPLVGDDDGGQLFPICELNPADCRDTLASAARLLDRSELAVAPAAETTAWFCGPPAGAPLEGFEPSPWRSRELPATGYCVMRNAAGDHLLFDAGPHGFLNGGHAHADALSITLTIAGQPFIVDPGTATYTMDAEVRDRFRSTAMHNTVVVSGRSQSIPEGPFHWRSRTDAHRSMWHTSRSADYAEGRHDGYGSIVHARSVVAIHGVGWLIVDHLLGTGPIGSEAFWHIHPAWQPARTQDGAWTFGPRDGVAVALASSAALEAVTDGRHDVFAPEYGRIERAACLEAPDHGALPYSIATLIVSRRALPRHVRVQRVPVDQHPGPGWHAAAFTLKVDDIQGVLLASVERTGAPGANDAAPREPWGAAGVFTDGRVAATLSGPGGDTLAAAVNATWLDVHGTIRTMPDPTGVVALRVHEASGVCVE